VERERERIGRFVVTKAENLDPDFVVCANCKRQLAVHDREGDRIVPGPQELVSSGAVPVPNFGWFCSQICGDQYLEEFDIRFQGPAPG
jgi:hypothetical protein